MCHNVYVIDLIMTWSHGLMEYKGRIICNAKDDQVVVDQFLVKNTSNTLKNIRRRRRNSTTA